MESTVADVRRILASVVGSDVVESLADDEQFFARGVVDSLHLVEIIDYLQSDLGIAVSGEDLSPEHFGSINGIARFVESDRSPTSNPT
jgi:acyl carrier protein